MELIVNNKDLLSKKSVPVKFGTDLSFEISQMNKIMNELGGVGLSAIQVGDARRFFITNTYLIIDIPTVVINPIIDFYSNGKERLEEGCLSFPNQYKEVSRSSFIHVKYYNENWEEQELYLRGIESRVFQHEYDHLYGITIF